MLREIRENELTEFSLNQFVIKVGGARNFVHIFEDFLLAMQTNKSIESANIILRFLDVRIKRDYQVAFFQSIGSLPALKAFRFVSTSAGFTNSALTLVTTALKHSNLESLTLQSIHLQRSAASTAIAVINNQDLEMLAEFRDALARQTRLHTFIMDDVEETFGLDGLVDVLLSLPCLNTIVLKSHMVTQAYSRQAMERLFQSTTVTNLSVKRFLLMDILPPLCTRMANNYVLKELCLEQVGISDESGIALAHSLEYNSTLEKLSIRYNGLSDSSGSTLVRSLIHNQSLRYLNLTGNDIASGTCHAIADLLTNSTSPNTLEHLNLAQNPLIKDDGVVPIAAGLALDQNLKHLILAETNLTGVSSAMMEVSLRWNQSLELLNLADNSLGDEGCSHMASLLRTNTTLKQLNLCRNEIGDFGALVLAQVLRHDNSTLESLNISGNYRLTNASSPELEAMMEDNCTLEHFWFPSSSRAFDNSSISSYLQLNKYGRKQLLQEMDNASLWTRAIEHFCKDLQALYHLVRANPTVLAWLSQES